MSVHLALVVICLACRESDRMLQFVAERGLADFFAEVLPDADDCLFAVAVPHLAQGVSVFYAPCDAAQLKFIGDVHTRISVTVKDDSVTPPNSRAPSAPLNVVVAATEAPALTRNVVALVVPAVMRCVSRT